MKIILIEIVKVFKSKFRFPSPMPVRQSVPLPVPLPQPAYFINIKCHSPLPHFPKNRIS